MPRALTLRLSAGGLRFQVARYALAEFDRSDWGEALVVGKSLDVLVDKTHPPCAHYLVKRYNEQ